VRTVVADLNHRIMEWRRIPVGPPIFVPLVDEDAMVAAWQAAKPAAERFPGVASEQQDATVARPKRWWRRRRQART
jgi:hypothetical protein